MIGKKMSLRVRAVLLVAVLLLTTNLGLGALLATQAHDAMKTLIDGRMLDIVNTAAAILDGDILEKLEAEDHDTPEYQAMMGTLSCFQKNINLAYIYCVRDMGNRQFVFTLDPDEEDPAEFGSFIQYTDALYTASQGTPAVDDQPFVDRWGRFYSAYSPVFNSDGKVAGIVAADFDAAWYEGQINQNTVTIIVGCLVFLGIVIGLTLYLTGHYEKQMATVKTNLTGLAEDMNAVMREFTRGKGKAMLPEEENDGVGVQELSNRISSLRDSLRQYISHASTQAHSMITAMASDYRSVYHVNLDENDGVCFRGDPSDQEQTQEGIHFPYLERFTWYAEHCVSEKYREGFLQFISPDNIRESLATQPIIAYRYLAKRQGREYYEMIRMAGVRRATERDDHMVHAVGLGFTEIDAEMRESMAKNEALAEALTMAEEASKAKTAFLSNMSHEIRTPMNAIIGLDNLALHDETLTPQTRDYLEKIGGSARHLLSLINDILDMSRIESGRLVLRREEFSFSAMLEQINTMVMSQCADKGLKYECRVLSRVDDHYIGDDMKLKEVLINILSNAIKFTNAPGSVTLSIERAAEFEDQSTLKFRIRDTGIGMDKEFIPKIFEAFSQEDSGTKNKFGSTGLGMAITKSIVEMMNGTISVESEKGVGTEFTVAVTLKNCERQGYDAENVLEPGKLRVLVVDDEEIAAEHARMVLDEAGIRVDVCGSGEAALQMLEVQQVKQAPYNLVLLDRDMPGMDGLEAARRIRERYSSENTVIILTAYNWDDIMDEALRAGVDSFLSKPLFASSVIAEFERVARRHNMSLFEEKKRTELAGRRILLAEDMEINAEIIMDILAMKDAETDHAENGRIVVDMFKNSAVDAYAAILMDVRMPEMDGLEAAAAIRALDRPDAKRIPIIALTANAFDEDVQRSLQAGMNAHLSKPVEPDHLYQTLEELIYEAEAEKTSA